jgi:hypothetical protein
VQAVPPDDPLRRHARVRGEQRLQGPGSDAEPPRQLADPGYREICGSQHRDERNARLAEWMTKQAQAGPESLPDKWTFLFDVIRASSREAAVPVMAFTHA